MLTRNQGSKQPKIPPRRAEHHYSTTSYQPTTIIILFYRRRRQMITDEELAENVHNVLLSSDLSKTSNTSVRRKLEHDLGVDLSDRRVFIREQVNIFLQSQYDEIEVYHIECEDNKRSRKGGEDEDLSEYEEEKDGMGVDSDSDEELVAVDESGGSSSGRGSKKRYKKQKIKKEGKARGSSLAKLCVLSPQLQKILGVSSMARPQVMKHIWDYVKEKKLQDPNDGKNFMCDELLFEIFGTDSVNILKMSKPLSKHILSVDSSNGSAAVSVKPGPKDIPVPKVKLRKQARKKDPDEAHLEAKKPKKKASGFLAPKRLSESMVKFIGTGEDVLTRTEVIKRIWDHIRKNDLQDPSDRKRIVCDEKLKELFKVDYFDGFTVTKLLTGHFVKL